MRLAVDVMCGGIVPYLRMCGHDTVYVGDEGIEADVAILEFAGEGGRTVLTRDVELASRAEESILLESRETEGQLAEVLEAGVELDLDDEPTYCGVCNGRLEGVGPTEPTPEYAPGPEDIAVWRCRDCGQCFWKGSHWDRVGETLTRVHAKAE
ncbi:Mut7-C RNAse domain-containing protein [Natrialbaceae archaeon A-gly3]